MWCLDLWRQQHGAQDTAGVQSSFAELSELFLTPLQGRLPGCLSCLFQEPTDSLEDSLLSSRPEFIIGPEGEEEENPSSKHGENPGNRTEPVERAGRCALTAGECTVCTGPDVQITGFLV